MLASHAVASDPTAEKLLRWIAASFPADRQLLRPPATDDAFDRLRSASPLPLPPALEALWRLHDGQREADAGGGHLPALFHTFYWLSIDEALSQAALMTQVLDDVRREHPDTERWADHWLPIAGDIGGGVLVADLLSGEVFEYQSDGDGREAAWGTSFDDFIDRFLARFDRKELQVNARGEVVDTKPPELRRDAAPVHKPRVLAAYLIVTAVIMAAWIAWLERR
jgi:cell wall assembly regulator SMI1